MSRLRDEIAVIPRPALVLSLVLAGGIVALVSFLAREEELVARIAIGVVVPSLLLLYLLLVSYVYGDAKRRGMRPVLWTLIALFVPNAIGIIAYFILRESVLHPCPSCSTPARREYAFCPSCGITLPRACPSCHRPVEPIWTHCAHCGGNLPAGELEKEPVPEPGEEPEPNETSP